MSISSIYIQNIYISLINIYNTEIYKGPSNANISIENLDDSPNDKQIYSGNTSN